MTNKIRAIALYLPQFHPIPENDKMWGKGFTEWTNVANAKPFFPGHYQPHIPADLGFYDLRVQETQIAQAEMAQQHGIEGFAYWHYWFEGKRLLEKPFAQVLESKRPDFPFCLSWANATWTGIWYGDPKKIMMEQTYGGVEDAKNHFYSLLKAFKDPRYIKIDGKPVFLIYKPMDLPDSKKFIALWQSLAIKEGLSGVHFLGFGMREWKLSPLGFDGTIVDNFSLLRADNICDRAIKKIVNKKVYHKWRNYLPLPTLYSYKKLAHSRPLPLDPHEMQYPCVIPNWDNTPRSKNAGVAYYGSTPDLFKRHLTFAADLVRERAQDHKLVFIKSWNEWAEGNHLEPDLRFGVKYLSVVKQVCSNDERG